MIITAVQGILYGITVLGVGITLWHVAPRPWHRNG